MKNRLRITSLLLAGALSCSLFSACGNSAGQKNDSAAQTKNETSAAVSTQKEDPVVVTLKTYHGGFDGNENFVDTAVGKIIKEKANVIVKVLSTKSDNSGAQAFVIDAAAGNLPDVMLVAGWESNQLDAMKKAGMEGQLADMSEALKNSGPVLSQAIDAKSLPLYLSNKVFDPDFGGKIYIIPNSYTTKKCWSSGNGLYIRGDVAKNLNLSTPDTSIKSMDDLYNVLVKIKDSNPKDINGGNAYPMGGLPGIGRIETRPLDLGGNSRIAIVGGKATGVIESQYASDKVMWVRKMLKEGLIDPEAITQSWDKSLEKIGQGKYVIFPQAAVFASKFVWAPTMALYKANPEMEYKPLGNMLNVDGKETFTVNIAMEAGLPMAVSKNANVNAVIRLLNFICDNEGKADVTFGEEGKQWNWNEKDIAQLTKEAYDEYNSDNAAYSKKYGANMLTMFANIPGDNSKYNKQFPETDNENSIFVYNDTSLCYKYYYDQEYVAKLTEMVNASTPVREYVADKLPLRVLYDKFPGKTKIDTVWNKYDETLKRAYLAKSDDEAKKILEAYKDSLIKCGYNDYLKYIQEEFDKNPGMYAEQEGD